MEIEVKKFLWDIFESINSTESFLGDTREFKIYMGNMMLRRAVERDFEIMGEAMSRIDKVNPENTISSKRQI